MWPASDFDFNGTSCTHTVRFNESESWYSRVDTAMSWFSHKTKPANLVMLYIEQPDSFGHIYSPESEIVSFDFFLNQKQLFQLKCLISYS